MELLESLQGTDVYLIDQLLKDRVGPKARIVDVGAGGGRNLSWFLRRGHDVRVIEPNEEAWFALGERFAALGVELPADRRHVGAVEELDLPEGCGDLVICNAVLHFARDTAHFEEMLRAAWRLVAPGGLFFARLASSVGIEEHAQPLGGGRYWLPDDSERFLVDESTMLRWTAKLGGELADPLKSTVVQSLRTMSTWVMWK